MKKRFNYNYVVVLLVFFVLLIVSSSQITIGKFHVVPYRSHMSALQTLAQNIFLSNAYVQETIKKNERYIITRVDQVLASYANQYPDCNVDICYQVDMYNLERAETTTGIVEVQNKTLKTWFTQPYTHPIIDAEMQKTTEQIIINSNFLTRFLKSNIPDMSMHAMNAGVINSPCQATGLCAAVTYQLGLKNFWVFVDLASARVVGTQWTQLRPSPVMPPNATNQPQPTCPPPAKLSKDDWQLGYEVTKTEGLAVYNVRYKGKVVVNDARVLQWTVNYGVGGFEDSGGCAAAASSYGNTQVLPLKQNGKVVGFELVQDFRMLNWGDNCAYRYENRYEFYKDGTLKMRSGAYGRGCGIEAAYRPLWRVNIPKTYTQFWLKEKSKDWVQQPIEGWWYQQTSGEMRWKFTDKSGIQGYTIDSDTSANLNQGDQPFVYITRHKLSEGDVAVGLLARCCSKDYQQGPHYFTDGESVLNTQFVVWYVPQLYTSDVKGKENCWVEAVTPKEISYPCFGGPIFQPIENASAPSP